MKTEQKMTEISRKISPDEALGILNFIDRGVIKLPEEQIKAGGEAWHSDVTYKVNGWTISFFIKADTFKFIRSIESPDGRRLDYHDIVSPEYFDVLEWRPSEETVRERWGFEP